MFIDIDFFITLDSQSFQRNTESRQVYRTVTTTRFLNQLCVIIHLTNLLRSKSKATSRVQILKFLKGKGPREQFIRESIRSEGSRIEEGGGGSVVTVVLGVGDALGGRARNVVADGGDAERFGLVGLILDGGAAAAKALDFGDGTPKSGILVVAESAARQKALHAEFIELLASTVGEILSLRTIAETEVFRFAQDLARDGVRFGNGLRKKNRRLGTSIPLDGVVHGHGLAVFVSGGKLAEAFRVGVDADGSPVVVAGLGAADGSARVVDGGFLSARADAERRERGFGIIALLLLSGEAERKRGRLAFFGKNGLRLCAAAERFLLVGLVDALRGFVGGRRHAKRRGLRQTRSRAVVSFSDNAEADALGNGVQERGARGAVAEGSEMTATEHFEVVGSNLIVDFGLLSDGSSELVTAECTNTSSFHPRCIITNTTSAHFF